MSGGDFDYIEFKLRDVSNRIECIIDENDSQEVDQWGDRIGSGYSNETIQELKTGVDLLRRAAVYAQRIDWLVSCDDSEETFHKRLENDLKELDDVY